MIIKAGLEYAQVLTELGAETFISSHRKSAPAHEIVTYLKSQYTVESIRKEIENPKNVYHIIKHENVIAGFSKMELNKRHPAVEIENASKLEQIYLLDSFHGLKLGAKLLKYNIEYSKARNQDGMWLVVWIGNEKAISFYEKFGFVVASRGQFQLTSTHVSPCYIMLLNYESN
jgi:ribosomal protein S18 acetylase RimI-like enzyme